MVNKKLDGRSLSDLEEQALETAKVARADNGKRRGEYSSKDLVKDILRISSDPNNPHFGTCSRKRYRDFGWYPERVVVDTFGNHQEFQRAANLLDARTASQYKNRRARLKTEEKIATYFEEVLKPFEDRFIRRENRKNYKHIVVGSDFHGEYIDPFTFEVFLDVIKRTEPDVVCLNGDVVDFPAVSRWSKDPRKILNLQQEIDFTKRNIFSRVRKAAPHAQIDWVIGNHEYRLVRFLADAAPGLCSLDCLHFAELFDVEEYKINLVFGNTFLSPDAASTKAKIVRNWKVYWDTFVVTHGNSTGKHPSANEIEKFGMSGTSGHVHRPQMYSLPTLINQYADWLVTGMMCKHEAGDDYIIGPTRWTNGFGFVTVFPDEKVALQQPILVKKGLSAFAGKIYRSKE